MPHQVPVRSGAPAAELVSLDEAKLHLRVDGSDEDDLVTALVAAAINYVDGYLGILGRALITQEWTWRLGAFPDCGRIRLPLGDLLGDVEIRYFDSDNAEQAFTGFDAWQDVLGPVVALQDGASWPDTAIRPDAVSIVWTCGFGADADAVPADIKLAVKMLAAHWYANREAAMSGDINEIPLGPRMLLERYRKVGA